MRTIWKYKLGPDARQNVFFIPRGAEVLTVQHQPHTDSVCMWAIVEDTNEVERRQFLIAGTGHELPPAKLDYVGTFQIDGGSLVFHVLEVS
jgi:hypothetical protein